MYIKLICTLSFWATTKRNTMTDRMRCNKGIQCDLATVTSNTITKKQGDHHILLSTENRTISNRNKDIQTCLDYLKKSDVTCNILFLILLIMVIGQNCPFE